MKVAAALLKQWYSENPARLLQAALWQAERLSEMAPELEALRAQNASLDQQLEAKTKRIAELEKALEAAQRAAHRQAAPFRVEPQKRAVAPKRPGRQRGHPGAFRHQPEQIDEDIKVELCSCPHCGGQQFRDQSQSEQFIEELPPVRPQVIRLRTYEAICVRCGQSVRWDLSGKSDSAEGSPRWTAAKFWLRCVHQQVRARFPVHRLPEWAPS